jgi:U32 family peptidase
MERRAPELLAPAGHWPQLHAAVRAGADAVYFGLHHFSARAKVGFTLDELPEAIAALHEGGVRGFVTFNTLVFEHEWRDAERAIAAIAAAGADAVIVQDVGIAELAQRLAPGLAVHGSTQMSITSAQGVAFAAARGVRRVVLGRELALADLRRIRAATDVDLEVFVHGALCVSYSGQCFSSEAWGGRSANRGKCAQACRLPYDLIVDGVERPLADERYLLSPGDLMALDVVPDLVRLGIDAFKIEGRYKDADYVALTTLAYRRAIDAAVAGAPPPDDAALRRDLEQVYSRGLGPHFLAGTDHRRVVRGRSPGHRGLRLGTVVQVDHAARSVRIAAAAAFEPPGVALAAPTPPPDAPTPRPGDGVVFDAAHRRRSDDEPGGRVHGVSDAPGGWWLRFAAGDVDLRRIRSGDAIWRSDDPTLPARVRARLAATPPRTTPLELTLSARVGESATLAALTPRGERAVVATPAPVLRAAAHPLDLATARTQLARLGGTPFHLGSLTLDLDGEPFLPTSTLNALRRDLVAALLAARRAPDSVAATVLRLAAAPREGVAADAAGGRTRLHALVRTPTQLDAVLRAAADGVAIASVTLDYLELYGLRPSVERIRAAGLRPRVASPRVLKPAEQRVVRFLRDLDADVLVRSAGLLHDLAALPQPPRLIGDTSLNVTNAAAAQAFLAAGLAAFAPGYDLDAAQVAELATVVGGGVCEVVLHHHLPVFHTEHCVFCRFLSSGKDYTDCGHPCETHRVSVRDPRGREHPVLADVGCRNTVFGAEAQSAVRHWATWRAAGLRDARVEFVHAEAREVDGVLRALRALLDDAATERETETALRAAGVAHLSEGSYFVPPAGARELPLL